MALMSVEYEDYLRMSKFPHIWCPGCGDGIILKSIIRAIKELELKKDNVTIVSGIGCSSRLPGYVDFNTLHTTHGRSIAFGIGVKLAKPEMTVLAVMGDGDAVAIGGNHFIHACRRNIDMTCIIFNNYIYGMTGGQVSPTTPRDRKATTAPYGNPDQPFDIVQLAIGAGATFVARGDVYHAVSLDPLIKKGIQNKGFSVIEVMVPCPTSYGRKNKFPKIIDMYEWLKDTCISQARAKKLSPEELESKIVTGIFKDESRIEFTENYRNFCQRVKEQVAAKKK